MDACPHARKHLWSDSGHHRLDSARRKGRARSHLGQSNLKHRAANFSERRRALQEIDLHIEEAGEETVKNCFQKSASVGLGTLLIVCLTVAAAPAQRKCAKPNEAVRQVAAASEVVNGLLRDKGAAAEPGARAVATVSMRNTQFYPRTLKIRKGDVVEWKNDDIVPHTATSASFDSGSMNPETSWRHMFTKAGQFAYVCTFHPTMTGVVVVK